MKLKNLKYLVVLAFMLLLGSYFSTTRGTTLKAEHISTMPLSYSLSLEVLGDDITSFNLKVSMARSISNDCGFIINSVELFNPTNDFLLQSSIWRDNQKRTEQRFISYLKN